MTTYEALAAAQAEAEKELLPLLFGLQSALAQGKDPERLVRLLILTATHQAFPPATDAVAQTLSDLVRVSNLPQQTQGVAVQVAVSRGEWLGKRALEVLAGRSEAFVSPYTRLAAQVLIWDSHREGAAAGAEAGGATHKTFTRLRQVREPRAHSRLEGVTIPVGESFVIGGVPCFGPGDPALPWSEKAWCGHILKFSRR